MTNHVNERSIPDLKARADVNESPKQGYQWPHKNDSFLQIFFLKSVTSHLSVSPDDGAEKLPGPAPAVHSHHAQYLEEPESPQRRRGEHLTAAPQT